MNDTARSNRSKQKSFFKFLLRAVVAAMSVGLALTCAFAATPENFGGKHIIGYFPDWASEFAGSVEYDKVTHINYFSIEPRPDGELNANSIDLVQLTQVVQAAHAAGTTVSISIGGGERCGGFPEMTANPTSRGNFIQKITVFMDQYNLDGVDLDWEPINNNTERDNYSTLIKELRLAIGPDKLLSAAVSSWHYDICASAVSDLTWVEVMAYDMNWPHAAHSTYEDTIKTMKFWEKLPVPKSKLIMGLPFYGRNDDSDAQAYSWIVDTYSPLPNEDAAGGYGFNGIDTIRAKTAYVYDNNYGGVMIWHPSQDKQGQGSLLAAVASRASKRAPTINWTW